MNTDYVAVHPPGSLAFANKLASRVTITRLHPTPRTSPPSPTLPPEGKGVGSLSSLKLHSPRGEGLGVRATRLASRVESLVIADSASGKLLLQKGQTSRWVRFLMTDYVNFFPLKRS